MIYDFLYTPRNILTRIRAKQSELEGLRLSMYPSAVRYDKDKVISSPSDPMPRYAERFDELQTTIKQLQTQYMEAQDAITKVALSLNGIEQEVIMLRYVAQMPWNKIALELNRTERWMFIIHKRAVRKLEKKFPNL